MWKLAESLCIYGKNTTCEGTCESWFWQNRGSGSVDAVCLCEGMFVCFCTRQHGRLCGCCNVIVVVWLPVVVLIWENKEKLGLSLSIYHLCLGPFCIPSFFAVLCNTTNLYIIISVPLSLSDVLLICLHVLLSCYTCCRKVWKLSFVRQSRRILKGTAEQSVILPCWVYNFSSLLQGLSYWMISTSKF